MENKDKFREKRIGGTRLLLEEELNDLEGKVENATPIGLPVTYVHYQAKALGDLYKLLKDCHGAQYAHYSDNIKEIPDNSFSNDARIFAEQIMRDHIRLAWNVPEEADAYTKSSLKAMLLPTGVIVTTAVQYYKIR